MYVIGVLFMYYVNSCLIRLENTDKNTLKINPLYIEMLVPGQPGKSASIETLMTTI
jgi:hypothetical protein